MLSIPHLSSSSRRDRRQRLLAASTADEQLRNATTRHDQPQRALALPLALTAATVAIPPPPAPRAVSPRRARRISRSCRNLQRFGVDYVGFRRAGNVQQQRTEDALASVQQQVAALERRRALLESLHFTRYTNARQLAADKVREYYTHFSRGFDPTRRHLLESIVRSVLLENVQSPAFQSIDQFLQQWANYSMYHAQVSISIQSIQPLDDDGGADDAVVVKCAGLTTLRISRDTITHFFHPITNDEPLVQQLIGKEYCFPFVTLFHFARDSGRVFKLEPRADLAGGLFNLVSDPFATVKLLRASQLTSDGLLSAYPEPDKPASHCGTSAAKPPSVGAAG